MQICLQILQTGGFRLPSSSCLQAIASTGGRASSLHPRDGHLLISPHATVLQRLHLDRERSSTGSTVPVRYVQCANRANKSPTTCRQQLDVTSTVVTLLRGPHGPLDRHLCGTSTMCHYYFTPLPPSCCQHTVHSSFFYLSAHPCGTTCAITPLLRIYFNFTP